jgi:ankyrin repeat protein
MSALPFDQTWLFTMVPCVMLFLALLWRYMRPRKSARDARAALPAFDVEGTGNGVGSGSNDLPASVAAAAVEADIALLRIWLDAKNCAVDAVNQDGSTALHLSARHGHANALRLLVDRNADPLCTDAEMRTPLHLVAEFGHGLCVKALLDAGADPDGKDANGKTPLQLAQANGHMGCLRMMKLHQERRLASANTLRPRK